MNLEEVIKKNLSYTNCYGLVVNYGDKVEVHWWKEDDKIIRKFFAEISISKPLIFSYLDGHLELSY